MRTLALLFIFACGKPVDHVSGTWTRGAATTALTTVTFGADLSVTMVDSGPANATTGCKISTTTVGSYTYDDDSRRSFHVAFATSMTVIEGCTDASQNQSNSGESGLKNFVGKLVTDTSMYFGNGEPPAPVTANFTKS